MKWSWPWHLFLFRRLLKRIQFSRDNIKFSHALASCNFRILKEYWQHRKRWPLPLATCFSLFKKHDWGPVSSWGTLSQCSHPVLHKPGEDVSTFLVYLFLKTEICKPILWKARLYYSAWYFQILKLNMRYFLFQSIHYLLRCYDWWKKKKYYNISIYITIFLWENYTIKYYANYNFIKICSYLSISLIIKYTSNTFFWNYHGNIVVLLYVWCSNIKST